MVEPVLEARGITRRYGARTVLDGVSFEIPAGTVLALCGASGAGKTTAVRIVAGLLGFDAGELAVGGFRVGAGRPYPRGLFGRIGVVFQEYNLFPHQRALENVRFALRHVRKMERDEATEHARAELARVGLADEAGRLPSELSSGERQRVAIARALALDPYLLLLDEPTSSLDPAAVRGIERLILQLAESGTTMLLVSHNVGFARRAAQRFGLLDAGRLEVSDDARLLDRLAGD